MSLRRKKEEDALLFVLIGIFADSELRKKTTNNWVNFLLCIVLNKLTTSICHISQQPDPKIKNRS